MTTNTAIRASNPLKIIEQLPRYSYGYKSDEWGMGSHLTSFIKDTGAFLKRDEVLAALASATLDANSLTISRVFLERVLAAMEGVIDVADRKTDEFEALRSCVIDLTLALFDGSAQQEGKK